MYIITTDPFFSCSGVAYMKLPLFIVLLSVMMVVAKEPAEKVRVVGVVGDAKIMGKKAKVGMQVSLGDTLVTGLESSLQIRNSQGTGFSLSENSVLVYTKNQDTVKLIVKTGGVLSIVKPGRHWQVQTKSATAAVRGTKFFAFEDSMRAYYCTCHGHVYYDTKQAGPVDENSESHKAFQFLPGSDTLRVAPLILHSDSSTQLLMDLL